LLEREFEVRALESALTDLGCGRGGVVVLEATAGLGKTALIRYARGRALARGFGVLSARGAELETDFTFGVVRQLFESVLPRHGPERDRLFTGAAKATQTLFAADGPGTPGGSGSLHILLNGLYWLLVNLAEKASAVVLVDDMQWVDPPSARFLGFLARRVDSVAVTIIVSSRASSRRHDESLDEILTAGDVTLLEPKGLSKSAVADLVRRTFGQDGDDEFCMACHSATAGNPLFLRELLRILAGDGTRPEAAAAASARASGPDAVRRHVIARLRRWPESVRSVARAVAVLGDDTDLALAARQCDLPLPATAAATEQLARDGMFERADPPAFVHAVVRDVVYSLIPHADRSAQHERAAGVLQEAGQPVARAASHLLRTTPAANPDRIATLLAAADQARKRGSPGGAAVYLLRARNEPPPPQLRSEVSRLLGNCQAHHLALADAERHLLEALALADSPAQRALCAYSLARFRSASGVPGAAVDLLAQAMRDLPADLSGDPGTAQGADLSAELEAELIGVARADLGRRADLLAHLDSFRRRPDAPAAVANAQLSVEAMFGGEPAGTVATLALRALAGRLPPDRSAIWAAIHTLMVADRLDEAESSLNEALDTVRQRGLMFPTALVRSYSARLAYLRGDLVQAREHLEAGSEGVFAPNGALPVLQATQVDLLVEDGRLAEADAIVRGGPLSGDREPDTVWQLWLLGARARLHAAQGNATAALADAMTCERSYQRWGADCMLDVPWRLQAADAYRRLDDHHRAAALTAEHLRLARAFGVPRHIAIALRTAATLAGTAEETTRLLHEAIDLLQDSPARLELARTLERLGQALLDGGNRKAGLDAVRRSAELAAESHASVMVERLRALLVGSGGRLPPAPTGVRAFTPSERQVAQLAAIGLTNRQIAERLFLSEKTIEAHLSRAYRKLGVRSRTQLAVHLAAVASG
jgi:DNA-binding CsgD family transcriptional regulator